MNEQLRSSIKQKKKERKEWFNGKCDRVNKERDRTWLRMKRKSKQKTKEYKLARNKYVKVRREEEKRYKKDILVDNCKEEIKLFYRLINRKLKRKERVAWLKERNG